MFTLVMVLMVAIADVVCYLCSNQCLHNLYFFSRGTSTLFRKEASERVLFHSYGVKKPDLLLL